jgi:hypothetical protein
MSIIDNTVQLQTSALNSNIIYNVQTSPFGLYTPLTTFNSSNSNALYLIGNTYTKTQVDNITALSNFYNKSQVDNIATLTYFYNKSTIDTNFYTKGQSDNNYYSKSSVDTLLNAKEAILTFSAPLSRATNTISINLNAYATFSALNSCNYITTTSLNSYVPFTALNSCNYITSSSLTPYATFTALNSCNYIISSSLTPYATFTALNSCNYITTTSLTPYATFIALNSCNYITNSTSNLVNYPTYGQIISSNFASNNLVVKYTDLTTSNFDTIALRNTALLPYATFSNVNSCNYIINSTSGLVNYPNYTILNSCNYLTSGNFVLKTGDTMTGNLGIGTTASTTANLLLYTDASSTNTNLNIKADNPARYATITLFNNVNNGAVISLGGSTASTYYSSNLTLTSPKHFHLFVNNGTTPNFSILSNNNVGIGNTNPTQILQVGSGGRLRISNDTTDYTLLGTIDVDGTTNTRIVLSGNTRASPYAGNIEYISTAGSHIFYTSATNEKMRILNNGNVGIGTPAPRTALDVQDRIYVGGNLNAVAPQVGIYGGTSDRLILWAGSASTYPFSLGIAPSTLWYSVPNNCLHSFFINGTECFRVSNGGVYATGFSYFGALDTSGLRVGKNDIFAASANGGGITIWTQNTAQSISLGYFGGNGIILTVNNTSVNISQPLILGNGMWHNSADGINRVYYGANGTSYFHSGNGTYIFRNTAQTVDILTIDNNAITLAPTILLVFNINSAGTNSWLQYPGTSPSGLADSFIFQHRDTGASKNSFWWFSGSEASTSSQISDKRSKYNIQDFTALDIIDKLKPKSFDVINEKDVNYEYGFIAQDIEKIPELYKLVHTTNDYIANVNSYGSHINENGTCIITANDDLTGKIAIGDELKFVSDNETDKEFIIDATPYINRCKRRYGIITEIISSNQFKIDREINNFDPFLIYGKKVEDAKSLDYNSFIALNTKAIQELHVIIQQQQEQINLLLSLIPH